MSLSLAYDAEANWIVVRGEGLIRLRELQVIMPDVAIQLKAQDCFQVLVDFREATLKLSILDLYAVPRLVLDLANTFGRPVHNFQRAVVVRAATDYSAFFETVSRMNGQNVKVFDDIELAKQWLQGR